MTTSLYKTFKTESTRIQFSGGFRRNFISKRGMGRGSDAHEWVRNIFQDYYCDCLFFCFKTEAGHQEIEEFQFSVDKNLVPG